MEKHVSFRCGDLELSGLFHRAEGTRGAVITHPHPLYGGDMYNPVVAAITRAYQKKGYTTLRFDFRGTGASQGTHGSGIGEQDDVAAALDFLFTMGVEHADLAGYSFGAWICALCAARLENVDGVILVAPPVEFSDFKDVASVPGLRGVIVGEKDEFAPVGRIAELVPGWNGDATVSVIKGADHFLAGFDHQLGEILASMIPGAVLP